MDSCRQKLLKQEYHFLLQNDDFKNTLLKNYYPRFLKLCVEAYNSQKQHSLVYSWLENVKLMNILTALQFPAPLSTAEKELAKAWVKHFAPCLDKMSDECKTINFLDMKDLILHLKSPEEKNIAFMQILLEKALLNAIEKNPSLDPNGIFHSRGVDEKKNRFVFMLTQTGFAMIDFLARTCIQKGASYTASSAPLIVWMLKNIASNPDNFLPEKMSVSHEMQLALKENALLQNSFPHDERVTEKEGMKKISEQNLFLRQLRLDYLETLKLKADCQNVLREIEELEKDAHSDDIRLRSLMGLSEDKSRLATLKTTLLYIKSSLEKDIVTPSFYASCDVLKNQVKFRDDLPQIKNELIMLLLIRSFRTGVGVDHTVPLQHACLIADIPYHDMVFGDLFLKLTAEQKENVINEQKEAKKEKADWVEIITHQNAVKTTTPLLIKSDLLNSQLLKALSEYLSQIVMTEKAAQEGDIELAPRNKEERSTQNFFLLPKQLKSKQDELKLLENFDRDMRRLNNFIARKSTDISAELSIEDIKLVEMLIEKYKNTIHGKLQREVIEPILKTRTIKNRNARVIAPTTEVSGELSKKIQDMLNTEIEGYCSSTADKLTVIQGLNSLIQKIESGQMEWPTRILDVNTILMVIRTLKDNIESPIKTDVFNIGKNLAENQYDGNGRQYERNDGEIRSISEFYYSRDGVLALHLSNYRRLSDKDFVKQIETYGREIIRAFGYFSQPQRKAEFAQFLRQFGPGACFEASTNLSNERQISIFQYFSSAVSNEARPQLIEPQDNIFTAVSRDIGAWISATQPDHTIEGLSEAEFVAIAKLTEYFTKSYLVELNDKSVARIHDEKVISALKAFFNAEYKEKSSNRFTQ